ncbi:MULTISPECIES: dicarboxylate/amino acid:cation symporter [unclassified Paludibacterium]|uniref:dicarboxylate/amino acid:cation symporter n=1 Tax=unclassified Paludibacterium TaxID=2618429 RepID=UPI001C03D700|nr:dicarboxylate/amino acid:cation symporter [Paludibacterium sp. B53371]BEV73742.1 dicarboxylate/amino acid:cation symporter [Paludibacterium sp. THUN1379]
MKSKKLTLFILLGMVLGILTGMFVRSGTTDPAALKSFADNVGMLTDIFLRLIKMIIAPLVFTTLVAGIARMGDGKSVGRVGAKTLMWFISASLLSLTLGLIMVNLFKPGVAVNLPLPDLHADAGIKASAMSVKDFITHAFPKSVFEAMANNEILQIVVFSLFFGTACAALGERAKLLVDLMDVAAHVMLKVTGYVMAVAPVAVFAALAATVTKDGLAILGTYGKFLGEFYLSIGLLWTLLIFIGFLFIGPRVLTLVRSIREPLLLSFSTASSEAAYPKTLEQLERFGVSNKIASFVLPMGYSFNLDGSMMYCTFATIFLAQAFNIPLTLTQEITMLLMFMVTSKGMAGVPRASLVVIAAMLPQFNIPEAGLLLILGIDHFLDMGRSATNVMGNSIATAVVAKWENELKH